MLMWCICHNHKALFKKGTNILPWCILFSITLHQWYSIISLITLSCHGKFRELITETYQTQLTNCQGTLHVYSSIVMETCRKYEIHTNNIFNTMVVCTNYIIIHCQLCVFLFNTFMPTWNEKHGQWDFESYLQLVVN